MAPVLTKSNLSDNDSSKHSYVSQVANGDINKSAAANDQSKRFSNKKKNLFPSKITDSRDSGAESEPRRKKKRSSRWGDTESDKSVIPGMPSILPSNLTKEQEKAYISKNSF